MAESNEVGGAYVNCWVKANSANEAQELASQGVASEGWVIESIEQPIRLVTQPDEETKERFNQAEVDGSCYEFHTWPVGDHSEEHLH
jgi:hypothetical protein